MDDRYWEVNSGYVSVPYADRVSSSRVRNASRPINFAKRGIGTHLAPISNHSARPKTECEAEEYRTCFLIGWPLALPNLGGF